MTTSQFPQHLPHRLAVALLALLCVQGCASTVGSHAALPAEPGPVSTASPMPEEHAVAPSPTSAAMCECPVSAPQPSAEDDALSIGLRKLAAGDYHGAHARFTQYQREATSQQAKWEAGIALAYASMLPDSPYYQPQQSRKAYVQLSKNTPEDVDIKALLMRDALSSFARVSWRVDELEAQAEGQADALRKQEEALKRLRDLTLGQKESAP